MDKMKDAIERGMKAIGASDLEKEGIRDMVYGVLPDANVVSMDDRRKLKDQKNDMHFRNKGRF